MNSFYEKYIIPQDNDYPTLLSNNQELQKQYPSLSLNMIQMMNDTFRDNELIMELIKMTFPMKSNGINKNEESK